MNIKSSIIENKYLKIRTLNIGASLYEVIYNKNNLILNLGSIENYKKKHPFVGSTCGRYANRIYKGQFIIKGKKYNLVKNEYLNTIHGGKRGFDKIIWKIYSHSKKKIVYNLKSKHLDQGFPGNLSIFCEYYLCGLWFFLLSLDTFKCFSFLGPLAHDHRFYVIICSSYFGSN